MKTNLTINTRRVSLANFLRRLNSLLGLCATLGCVLNADAQTLICGNLSSQTWVPAGNPYIITCDATVLAGQTLTIQPGVVVWIGSNVTLTANGLIQAVGTPGQRITFQSPVGSQYWKVIALQGTTDSYEFKYCDFKNATTAISQLALGGGTLSTVVANCTFSNCLSQAVFGESWGWGFNPTTVNLEVKNCRFNNASNGCAFYLANNGYTPADTANLNFADNIFQDLTGPALVLTVGAGAASSQAIFRNNTLVNCRVGVATQDPWDAKVQSCVRRRLKALRGFHEVGFDRPAAF